MAVRYVTSMMNFFGVKERAKVVIEGPNQFSAKTEEIISDVLEKALILASVF
ncbi:ACP phosphodiesterase [Rummeliibacillus pycnus]|uniref:ACP phosphodiesterase n=1 Tax=Rummeliibacillus pycnus TaxID=101070 RepID=UPI0037C9AFFB